MRLCSLTVVCLLVTACESGTSPPWAVAKTDVSAAAKPEANSQVAAPRDAAVRTAVPDAATAAVGKSEPDATVKTAKADAKKAGRPPKETKERQELVGEAPTEHAMIRIVMGTAKDGEQFGHMSDTDQGADLATAIGGGTRSRTGKIADRLLAKPKGMPAKRSNRSRVRVAVDDLSDSSLKPNDVARRMRARYLAGIKRCHERELKKDPHAAGRVELQFTVIQTGRLKSPTVQGFNRAVDVCIKRLMGHWRFSAPKDDKGQPTTAEFHAQLLLKPSH